MPDFIGFACREVASRIRGTVAAIPFEQFHKYSAEIVRTGVFGKDKDGKFNKELMFEANNLVSVHVFELVLDIRYISLSLSLSFPSFPS